MDKLKKPNLSASQLRQFSKCEAQWYFRYVLGMKTIPSGFLTLGLSFDRTINYNFEQKLKTRLDIKTDIMVDVFSQNFKELKDSTDFGADKPDDVRTVGIGLVKVYHRVVSPKIMPKLIQPAFEIGFENTEWTFIAIPDLITDNDVIVDNKTTARTPREISPDDLIQMHSYQITVNENEGKDMPSKVIYSVKKAEPSVVEIDVPKITAQDKKYWQYQTSMTYQRQKLIRSNELAPKTNRTHFLCTKKFCGYWSECEKLFGGKVKE